MAKDRSSSRTSRTRTTPVKTQPSPKKAKKIEQKAADSGAASERFVEDMLIRGEAAKPDQQGKLPPEATHAITKEEKDGSVKVKRARFKFY